MDAQPTLTELSDGIASRLQDMVLETSDAEEFFQELAVFSASLLSPPDSKVHCNVTVVRRKKPVTVACSDARARVMDELQYAFGDGPCLTTMRTGTTTYVPDVSCEHRWPEYIRAVAKKGRPIDFGCSPAVGGRIDRCFKHLFLAAARNNR